METYEFMKKTGEGASRIRRIYSAWAKAHGVNYNVLATLYTACYNDKCSQKYICEEWGVPKQTVNTTCRELTASGVIEQIQSTDDRREICISLTEKGKAFAQPLVDELSKIEDRILSRMGREDVARFFELFMRYAEIAKKEFTEKTP